jgi:putative transposase
MSDYIRAKSPGGTFFFTVVTHRRRGILTFSKSRELLREVVRGVQRAYPFSIDAWVLLPNHLHCLWTLPEGDGDFSKRWALIKLGFSKKASHLRTRDNDLSAPRQARHESPIWQKRFWEHQIRDDADLSRHLDYIHFNPVKHGLVTRVQEWPFSTFHRFVKEGLYPKSWGEVVTFCPNDDFGE